MRLLLLSVRMGWDNGFLANKTIWQLPYPEIRMGGKSYNFEKNDVAKIQGSTYLGLEETRDWVA
jgi:hypothetical protein